ncbi:replication protein [Actinobacillus pleuropneumoniae]|uniref:replication protein n=1 Tax=Actinobacillus pleuropneumoniae TaxID=715 RepID=UPI000045D91C|nr:replication protein [Actinobacillus pleuropneumoniae]UKH11279.1 replication protein [Actinobacillus pleuropneumoniae]VTR45340.1 phage replication protein O, N-terminal domain [Actinobacillus pleuropneumoniae]
MALPQSQQKNKPILRLHQTTQEAKKVSVDDGYTAIPNELLFAMGRFPFTQRQYAVILAVIQKTLSWRKEMDWICNEQLCELTGIKGEHKVSAVKNELVRMKVLTQKGRKIGLNLIISEWENPNLPEKGNLTQKGKTNLPEKGNRVYPKQVNTKETITKEKINNPPIVPQGERDVIDKKIFADAQSLLAYYNNQAKGTCRSSEPFLKLLTKTTSREAYTVDEIKLVIRWALSNWKSRFGKPKPENICRVKRFDGYISDAEAWEARPKIDYQAVVDAYNEILGNRLLPLDEVDPMAIQQIDQLLTVIEKKTVTAFRTYFQVFADTAREYFFEPENKIGFSFLMKPETLIKTRRGEI